MDIGSLTGSISIEDQLTGALTQATSAVTKFASEFNVLTGIVVAGATAIVAAVTGIAITIEELGKKGSTIQGVEDAFDALAIKAGTTGDALRGALSEGVKDTVSQFNLMKDTAKLLGSGMKLTADQALLMGQAARALGKATGTDASEGLSIMSSALTTGRTRGLQMQIGLIDVKKGEEEFAKSIGATVAQLNDAGKLEGKRLAILDATKQYLDRVGTSQLSFKEKFQQAEVAVEEWVGALAKGVATSPNVNRMLDTIGDALKRAFGGEGKTLMDNVISWINNFADEVTKWGPAIIDTLADIWAGIKKVGEIVRDLAPSLFQHNSSDKNAFGAFATNVDKAKGSIVALNAELLDSAGLAKGTLTGGAPKTDNSAFLNNNSAASDKATEASLAKTEQLWDQYYQLVDKMSGDSLDVSLATNQRWYDGQQEKLDKTRKLNKNFDDEQFALDQLYVTKNLQAQQTYAAAQVDILKKGAAAQLAAEMQLSGDTLATKMAGVAVQEQAAEEAAQELYNKGTIDEKTLAERRLQIQAEYAAKGTAVELAEADKRAKAVIATLDMQLKATQDYNNLIDQQTMTSTEYQIQLNKQASDAAIKAISPSVQGQQRQDLVNTILDTEKAKNDALFQDNKALTDNTNQNLDEMAFNAYATYQLMAQDPKHYSAATIEAFRQIYLKAQNTADGVKLSFHDAFANIGAAIPGLLQQALTGGGGIVGASKAIGSLAGSTLGSAISSNLSEKGSSAAKFMATDWGKAIGGAIPIIGSLIGPILGSVMNKLFGQAGRDAVKKFAEGLTGSSDLNQLQGYLQDKLGTAAGQFWTLLTQGTGRNNADQAAANIKKVQDALAALDADVSKYKLTWQDLVDKQGAATKSGQSLIDSFNRLKAVGYSTDSILTAMSGDLNQYITDAKNAGVQVPAAMKPILEQMLALNENQLHSAPTFAALDALATKYHLTADQMGSAFAKAKLGDTFQSLTDDLDAFARGGVDLGNILVTAGADGSKALSDLGTAVQGAIDDAMKYGVEVPANLKPAAQALIDQGLLLDANGKKITDISQIKFGDTLQTTLQTLNQTLKDLISALTGKGGVADSLDQTFNRTYEPHVKFRYDTSGQPDYSSGSGDTATGAAGGMKVGYYGQGGNVIAFTPRGTDKVPAMLTTGERVLSVAENAQYERGGMEQTIEVHLDDGVIATAVLKGLPKVAKVRGVNVGMR